MVGGLVEDGHIDDVGAERLAHLLADELHQGRQVELRGDRLTDAVDDVELGDPLAGLVDEAGVLQRDAEAGGERREQADVAIAERVLAVQVLEGDHPPRLIAHDERGITTDLAGSP